MRYNVVKKAFQMLKRIVDFLQLFWLFTKNDFTTFVLPNSAFGAFATLSKKVVSEPALEWGYQTVLRRLPLLIFFNWSNLLVFDLANQRLPASVVEDQLNKPWRPLPSGKISQQQTRYWLLVAIPLTLLFNSFLCVERETALLVSLTWIYNDLQGGDENWLIRNTILASAFFLYNLGSLKVASGAQDSISVTGYSWTATVSAVILTTIQVQDLKDQVGDRARGRRTAPLVLGDKLARWTIAVPLVIWSFVCPYVWDLELGCLAFHTLIGVYLANRVLQRRNEQKDRRTWQLWCLWTALLYTLPALAEITH